MPQQITLQNIVLQAERPLVHGVSLTLKRGRVLALVGGSGSGKSLTCAAALGILPPGVRQTAGMILADGQPARLLGKADEIQKLIHRSPSPFPARRKAPA